MRGRYKYNCDDCNQIVWLDRSDRSNRGTQICPACGSHFLSASKRSRGPERIAECNEAEQVQCANLKAKQNFRPAHK